MWDTEQLLLSLREVNATLHILEKSLPFCWSLTFCRRPSVSCVCSLTGATPSSLVNIKLVSKFVWRRHYLLEKKVNEMQMWVKWNTNTGGSLTLKHDDDDTYRPRSRYIHGLMVAYCKYIGSVFVQQRQPRSVEVMRLVQNSVSTLFVTSARRFYFHLCWFVCWFVSRITQKLLNRFLQKLGWRTGHSPEKTRFIFWCILG